MGARSSPSHEFVSRLDPCVVAELQERLLGWYAENRRDLPWRRTRDAYAILVSEVMLQQTQVSRVLPHYDEWLRAFPRLEDLAAAPLEPVLRLWQGLGYNNRARRLRDCAVMACERGGSPAGLPANLPDLLRLPGIGDYTARAVLVFAHNAAVAAVDTNVRRVLTHELHLSADLTPRALRAIAEAVLPAGRSRDWHNALMDYGALVVTSRASGLQPGKTQGVFVGSRRWQRSRLLRLLLELGPLSREDLAARLHLAPEVVEELLTLLRRDGLVIDTVDGARIA